MAHVPLQDEARGATSPGWPARYTRRRFGQMVEPTAGASHHSGRPGRDGQPRDRGATGLEEARPDAAVAGHPGGLGPRSAARGASTTATTRACMTGSIPAKVRAAVTVAVERPLRRAGAGRPRVRRGGDRVPGRGLRRAGRSDPHPPRATPSSSSWRPGWRWRTSVPASTPGSVCAARGSRNPVRSHGRARSSHGRTSGRRCLTRRRRGHVRGVALTALRHRLPHAGQRDRRRGRRAGGLHPMAAAGRRAGRVGARPTWSRS